MLSSPMSYGPGLVTLAHGEIWILPPLAWDLLKVVVLFQLFVSPWVWWLFLAWLIDCLPALIATLPPCWWVFVVWLVEGNQYLLPPGWWDGGHWEPGLTNGVGGYLSCPSSVSKAPFRQMEDTSILFSHVWGSGSAECLPQTGLIFPYWSGCQWAARLVKYLGVFRLSGDEILGWLAVNPLRKAAAERKASERLGSFEPLDAEKGVLLDGLGSWPADFLGTLGVYCLCVFSGLFLVLLCFVEVPCSLRGSSLAFLFLSLSAPALSLLLFLTPHLLQPLSYDSPALKCALFFFVVIFLSFHLPFTLGLIFFISSSLCLGFSTSFFVLFFCSLLFSAFSLLSSTLFSLFGSIFLYFFVFLPPSTLLYFIAVDIKYSDSLTPSSAEYPWLVFTVTTQG